MTCGQPLTGRNEEVIDLELGSDGVWAVPEEGTR